MPTLRAVKRRIGAVKNTQQVTRAMKMVSAARMKKAQLNMERARPYSGKVAELLQHVLPSISRDTHPLLKIHSPIEKAGFVIITADRGLCGSFNTKIIKLAENKIAETGKEKCSLICIGRRGNDYFRKRGYNVIGSYVNFFNELDFGHAVQIVEQINNLYVKEGLGEVHVIYNRFKNMLTQELRAERFLPLLLEENESVKYEQCLFEPGKPEIVHSLVPRHLNVQMWQYLLESNASEQTARMVAMDNATTNAEDLLKRLQLTYNKTRQAVITREILEVVSGAEAMKQ
ncbi:MAG TPA: ATP synthase F1 subunit gamma [Candidatus Marinimicrobia bacterium]|nr:ATP synthase F1 subunit gamma [Candidatus Neomarinimicrobiota bacterium]